MAMAAATAVVMATTAMAVTATAVTAMAEEIMVKEEVAMEEIMVKEEVDMEEIMVVVMEEIMDKGITVTAAMDLATKLEVVDTETADHTQIM